MRLGTLLLRDAVIGLSQLEEALRAQILYGGKLGTNLVELEYIDLDTLGLYLAKVHGVPVATPARLEAADPGTVARLGREVAERHLAFPLGPEPLRPEIVAVAMSEPRNPERIAAIQLQLDATIAPYAAAELRLLYYLERHYGIERRPRYLRPAEAVAPSASVVMDRRRTRPHPAQVAPIVRFEPKKRAAGQAEARRERPGSQGAAARPGSEGGAARERPPRTTLQLAAAAVARAEHRDQIAEAIMDLADGRLGAAALFIVRGTSAIGWRGQSPRGARLSGAAIEKLVVPLGGSSVLQSAFDTGRVHLGPSPAAGRPIERTVWDALGVTEPPDEMLVVPVAVAGRVVNLIYGHGPGGRPVAPEHARELEELARLAGEAYTRMIQAARIERLVR